MSNSRVYFPSALLLAIVGCGQQKTEEARRPNILFAISDDQSFAHTSFAGSRFVNTPAFDRIAGEGIFFTNCYAGSPGCAPSRSALVTGRHHWQNEQSGQHASSWMKKYIPFIDRLYLVSIRKLINSRTAPLLVCLWRKNSPLFYMGLPLRQLSYSLFTSRLRSSIVLPLNSVSSSSSPLIKVIAPGWYKLAFQVGNA